MRKAALLELHDVDPRRHLPEDALLVDEPDELVELQLEGWRHDVRAILWPVALEQLLDDLGPVNVERVRLRESDVSIANLTVYP